MLGAMVRLLIVCGVLGLTAGCKDKAAATPPATAPESSTPSAAGTPTPSGAAPQMAGARTDRTAKADVVDPSALAIAVTVDGVPKTWALSDIAKVRAMEVEGDSGEGARNAWSLRQVATTLVGPGARVVALADAAGKSVAIDAAGWADAARLPLLRVNRRGIVKFHWASPDGEPLEGNELRGVAKIELVTK